MKNYGFSSLLAPIIEQYRHYCINTGTYCDGSFERIHYFDVYFAEYERSGSHDEEQSAVNKWFQKRDTETNNSCRSRSYPVFGFIRYANTRGLLNWEIPELPDGLPCSYVPHIFTEKELKDFFNACDHIPLMFNNTQNIIRKYTIPVIFRTLYSTGMRTFECRELLCRDVDLASGIVNIEHSKHNIQHYIVLHDSCRVMLEAYNEKISMICPDREYFFPGTGRYPYLTKDWLCENFNSIWNQISDSYAKPYDFRHNYAIQNINNWTGDINSQFNKLVYLSKTMGHVTLDSTRYYYSYSPKMAELIKEHTVREMESILPEVNINDYLG